jgi:hypothetical protein
MSSELSPRNIRVNVVAPGAVRTPIWGAATATPEAEKIFEARIGRSTPLGRIGEPDHIAKTVLFLASDDAAHIQGQELFVDGGATASPAGAPIYRGWRDPKGSIGARCEASSLEASARRRCANNERCRMCGMFHTSSRTSVPQDTEPRINRSTDRLMASSCAVRASKSQDESWPCPVATLNLCRIRQDLSLGREF